ncbi:MAG: ParB/RepB/Spo0J family partition protein [Tidjanibacter sp.]|nr:ParB/RepB/Spo0J family partition protein [Tidjanibacter sp.]MBR7130199.1 ParB/RepB/Spo0J family partition protein [Tidjanibacter sp.]
MKQKGLGRGLSAILEMEQYVEELPAVSRMEEIDVESIIPNPKQPRTIFDDDALEELANSIATLGLIQPITVRREQDGKYIIISGERRWRASRLAGRKTIPAYIREADDKELHEMALVENIQRQDLNAMEIAISLQRLIDECGVTQETVAQRVGKKRSTVANYLRLMTMCPEVQAALKAGQISMGHAKAIAAAPEDAQPSLVKKVVKKELSVRATEQLARRLAEGKTTTTAEVAAEEEFPEVYTRIVEHLSRLLGEDIKIKRSADGSGKIIIGFAGDQQVADLVAKLERLSK